MKQKLPYLTIQAYAELFGITKHTLYHYEELGIFKPIYISPTGYRYYSYTQYDQLRFILLLREMDVPLEEIRQCLASTDSLKELLERHIQKVTRKMDQMRETLSYMEELLSYARACEGLQLNTIQLEVLPERIFYGSPIKDQSARKSYAKTMEDYAKFCYDHHVDADVLSGSRIPLTCVQEGAYYRYDFTFSEQKPEAGDELIPEVLPAGQWLTMNFCGRYENCYKAYEELILYAKSHQLVTDDYGYEFYVTNDIIVQNPDAQIIRVSIHIV